jgi:adenosine deaminase
VTSADVVARVPKVLLHDHLDGVLRPATVVELAADVGHALPASEPDALGRWFRDAADSGSLERSLETFAHTVGVMQTAEGLRRVAREMVEDQADDGVVYVESRFAPELHTERGLTLTQVVDAVLEGFDEGGPRLARSHDGRTMRVGLSAMRQADTARGRQGGGLKTRSAPRFAGERQDRPDRRRGQGRACGHDRG